MLHTILSAYISWLPGIHSSVGGDGTQVVRAVLAMQNVS